jgi:hypothetical protein
VTVAPSEKDTVTETMEKSLWDAAVEVMVAVGPNLF